MLVLSAACGGSSRSAAPAGPGGPSNALLNPTAYVPPQCYTLTEDPDGTVVNSCYTCHHSGREPNYVDDSDFQLEYSMVSDALRNPWRNLFVDRSARTARISDAEIRALRPRGQLPGRIGGHRPRQGSRPDPERVGL